MPVHAVFPDGLPPRPCTPPSVVKALLVLMAARRRITRCRTRPSHPPRVSLSIQPRYRVESYPKPLMQRVLYFLAGRLPSSNTAIGLRFHVSRPSTRIHSVSCVDEALRMESREE